MRFERIKNHFDEEVAEYDAIIRRLIPRYGEMVGALVSAIPFSQGRTFRAIDLGCGTGTVAAAVQEVFPGAEFTCVEISGRMLEIAAHKLGGNTRNPVQGIESCITLNYLKIINSNAKRIHTDKLRPYKTLIPLAIHKTTNRGTNHIERHSLTIRTHLKRLTRRTICFSRKLAMLYVVLKIYFWG